MSEPAVLTYFPILGEESLREPMLRRLYSYWIRQCGERRMPRRRDLDPVEMSFALGNLILVDVERDPPIFRFRLYGTNVARYFGDDLTGRTTGVFDDVLRDAIEGPYRRAIGETKPLYCEHLYDDGKRLIRTTKLVLPLSEDNDLVNMILVGHPEPEFGHLKKPGEIVETESDPVDPSWPQLPELGPERLHRAPSPKNGDAPAPPTKKTLPRS